MLLVVAGIAFAQFLDVDAIVDSVELGQTPDWDDAIFASVVAAVALMGVEAASGLAGEVRVGRRGLRRVVIASADRRPGAVRGGLRRRLMAQPVQGGQTALGGAYIEAPVLGIVAPYDPGWLMDAGRYVVGAVAAAMLIVAMNGQMLGLARLAYSLATNRQIPSAVGRLHGSRGTPYVAISIAALVAFALTLPHDLEFLAGVFAFGAMISFAMAHLSVIVLRFREADRPSAFRVPLSIRGRQGQHPAAGGARGGVRDRRLDQRRGVARERPPDRRRLDGARRGPVRGLPPGPGQVAHPRFTIPAEALQETAQAEYGSILVPVLGTRLDDDIVGTAGRLAAAEDEEGDGAVLEALYVFEIPMSLPIDARVSEERVQEAKQVLARAKQVGEEYEGVEVATAMVRGRTAGQAIVAEARRRGVEAIVLAAEEPTRVRGGAILGGRGRARDRFVGETTRYVVEKAHCRVILTAPPAGQEDTREGVLP